MGYVTPQHRGLAYGDGYLQADATAGQVLKLVGNDLFAVNTDPTMASFGVLAADTKAGEMPAVFCQGGVYETDVYEGAITAGADRKVSAAGQLTAGGGAGEESVARAINVGSGILKFRLLV